MLKSQDFDYHLPEELIAHHPSEKRDQSRLLFANCLANLKVEHKQFFDILNLIPNNSILILNDTKVISARIPIVRQSGGKGELLIETVGSMEKIRAMGRPSKRLKEGEIVHTYKKPDIKIKLHQYHGDGWWDIEFLTDQPLSETLKHIGEIPLPPYIERKEGPHGDDDQRYQTVFAENEGSTAAPTASLHFTDQLLSDIKKQGIEIYTLTHHVGAGTFLPVKTDDLSDHKMHCEYYEIPNSTAQSIAKAKQEKRPVIAAGTTVLRALESAAKSILKGKATKSQTELFIYPPYQFKVVDHLITNFHLPKSTLIMLVAAFMGIEETKQVYNLAVQERYRFFSFGDAMYIKR